MRPNGVTTWSFRAQRACWRYTSRGVKILTVLGQAPNEKKFTVSALKGRKFLFIRGMTAGQRGVHGDDARGGTVCLLLGSSNIFETSSDASANV
jgi:hypothetical protein